MVLRTSEPSAEIGSTFEHDVRSFLIDGEYRGTIHKVHTESPSLLLLCSLTVPGRFIMKVSMRHTHQFETSPTLNLLSKISKLSSCRSAESTFVSHEIVTPNSSSDTWLLSSRGRTTISSSLRRISAAAVHVHFPFFLTRQYNFAMSNPIGHVYIIPCIHQLQIPVACARTRSLIPRR